MLVQVHPSQRQSVPATPMQIVDRINEISFHGARVKELRSFAILRQLVHDEGIDPANCRSPLLRKARTSTTSGAAARSTWSPSSCGTEAAPLAATRRLAISFFGGSGLPNRHLPVRQAIRDGGLARPPSRAAGVDPVSSSWQRAG